MHQCMLLHSVASMRKFLADNVHAYYHGSFVEFVANMHGVNVELLAFP